jgi:hypothetical protein
MHEAYGITGELLIAGLCGGYVCAIRMRHHRARDVMASIIAGGFTGNYVSILLTAQTGADPLLAAFLSGVVWNVIVHKVLGYANPTRGYHHD